MMALISTLPYFRIAAVTLQPWTCGVARVAVFHYYRPLWITCLSCLLHYVNLLIPVLAWHPSFPATAECLSSLLRLEISLTQLLCSALCICKWRPLIRFNAAPYIIYPLKKRICWTPPPPHTHTPQSLHEKNKKIAGGNNFPISHSAFCNPVALL